MTEQLKAYLRQLNKTFYNQQVFTKQELLDKLHTIGTSLNLSKPSRLTFLLDECTCPTLPNLIKPNSKISKSCPYHQNNKKS